jgi:hypothetical protein
MKLVMRSVILLTACVRSRIVCGNSDPKLSRCQGDSMKFRGRFARDGKRIFLQQHTLIFFATRKLTMIEEVN